MAAATALPTRPTFVPMRICMLSKFPPIEGGEASKAYWLSRGLGARGHEVHVVTNAMEVEREYRERFQADDLDKYQCTNMKVHNTDPFIDPSYIPYAKPYTAKLAGYAIEIIREYDLQLIDSRYILPYGVSGFLAKVATGRPQILRHAGSDISRLYSSPYFRTLFTELFERVEKIVTYPRLRQMFLELDIPASKLFFNTKVSVDTVAFSPQVEPADLSGYAQRDVDGLPVITYIGKVGVAKGVFDMVRALSLLKEDFVLLLVAGGRGFPVLQQWIDKCGLTEKTVSLGLVPPWRVPSLIRASTCVVHPERDFPVPGHSPITPREVMASGTCLILSNELYQKRVSGQIIDGESVIVVDPKDTESFAEKLAWVVRNPDFADRMGGQARKVSESIEDFQGYVSANEDLYRSVLGAVE